MDEKNLDKAIGYALAIIVIYNLIGAFIPLLTWGVIAMIAFRVFQEYQRRK